MLITYIFCLSTGEKTSLLSKLFGRNKKKVGGSESSSSNGEGPEYATFSAQFPPPEWEWYQAHEQGLRQGVPKTQTWHHFGSIPQEAEEVSGDQFLNDSFATCMPDILHIIFDKIFTIQNRRSRKMHKRKKNSKQNLYYYTKLGIYL